MLAEILQIKCSFAACLQECCKYHVILKHICRKYCKQNAVLEYICRQTASNMQFFGYVCS